VASVVSICQEALGMIGARTSVSSVFPSDGSNEANYCATYYSPVIQSLLRSANWAIARKQVAATQLKALYVNGVLQPTAMQPPTPWWYEYAVPSDSLKERFILNICPQTSISPPLTSSAAQYQVPQNVTGFARFTPALGNDSAGNPIKVILTNQPQAQVVYTADISQKPDLWDAQFHLAASASLATYLINPLARNAELMTQMVQMASNIIGAARATDANESLPSTDHLPDFIAIRFTGAGYGGARGNSVLSAPNDSMIFGNGLFF
jgi:hypothetical protein